ncbi:MAG: hypothetical protein CL555_05925 [Algoriphagus sp.]|nr:hypothetical protein [Algoriphagus sp.]QDP64435.1 MAG: hypothetical protein Tp156MES38741_26 [Prokaryotic dsDNA virus sp.]|tara:strand:+ start:704 stop:1111 length:408 start_codon:yes stop_codon:yes gene_type:complete
MTAPATFTKAAVADWHMEPAPAAILASVDPEQFVERKTVVIRPRGRVVETFEIYGTTDRACEQREMLEQYRKAWIERQVGMTEKAAIEAEIQGNNSHFMQMVELTGAIPSVSAVLRSAFGEPDRFVTPRVAGGMA